MGTSDSIKLEYGVSRGIFLRVFKIIETQMPRAPGRDRKFVGPNRIAIFEKDRDGNVRVTLGSIEDAARFVAGHLRCGTMTLSRDETLRDRPLGSPNWFHNTRRH